MAAKTTLLEGVAQVLQQTEQPLHARDITKALLEQGLWSTKGKTPEATVSAQLYTDIKKKGTASAFVQAGKNTFALNPNVESDAPSEEHQSAAVSLGGSEPVAKRLTFTDAAEDVLRRHGRGGRPMHYKDITKFALDEDLVQTEGKTPEATLYAQVITENQRAAERGKQPRFVRHGKGMIGLADWLQPGAQAELAKHNTKAEAELLKQVRALDPQEFEQLIGQLLRSMGIYDVEVTPYSGDSGVDARGRHELAPGLSVVIAVQAKRWRANVQKPDVQKLSGAIAPNEQGLIITTSDFGKGAREEAARPDKPLVWLVNGEELVRLLVAHDIGVRRVSLEYYEATGLEFGDYGELPE